MVRTVSDLAKAMQSLEDAIRQKFLSALLGRTINHLEREVFGLALYTHAHSAKSNSRAQKN